MVSDEHDLERRKSSVIWCNWTEESMMGMLYVPVKAVRGRAESLLTDR